MINDPHIDILILHLSYVFLIFQPEESFSDDFLFPMTSRLSYTSAAESDGEFCGDELSPRRAGTLKQDPSGRLVRVASDPSLARQDGTIRGQDGTMKSEHGDYSLPPPYTAAAAPQQRDSHALRPNIVQRRLLVCPSSPCSWGFPYLPLPIPLFVLACSVRCPRPAPQMQTSNGRRLQR